MNLVQSVYEAVAIFPQEERYGLTSQMTRSAVSIPSNIAECAGRNTNREFTHFLSIAMGSMFELETQLLIAERVGYIDNVKSTSLRESLHSLQRMSTVFMNNLESKI